MTKIPRPNGWVAKTWCRGRYVTLHVLPSLQFTHIKHNGSLHVEVAWLFWEAKLNIFYKPIDKRGL